MSGKEGNLFAICIQLFALLYVKEIGIYNSRNYAIIQCSVFIFSF